MVDGGATAHTVNDIQKFKSFNDTLQPKTHSLELAGTAVICLLDNAGRQHKKWGSDNHLQEGDSRVVTKDVSRFDIHESGNLYYLPIVQRDAVDQCKNVS